MKKIIDQGKYIPRLIDDTVERCLTAIGAVCIEGPKWCGKTRTSSYHCRSEILIGDPANSFQNRELAEMSQARALLKAAPEKHIGDLETFGFLFEALCEWDLKIYAETFGAGVYHYQDYAGNEMDAVIELPDGDLSVFHLIPPEFRWP